MNKYVIFRNEYETKDGVKYCKYSTPTKKKEKDKDGKAKTLYIPVYFVGGAKPVDFSAEIETFEENSWIGDLKKDNEVVGIALFIKAYNNVRELKSAKYKKSDYFD